MLTLAQEVGVDRNLPHPNFPTMLRASSDQLYALNRGSITQADAATPDDFWRALLRNGGWWDTRATSHGMAPQAPNLARHGQQSGQRCSSGNPGNGWGGPCV